MSPPATEGTEPPSALHEYDQTNRFRPPNRVIGAVVSFTLLAIAFYYDYAILANAGPLIPGWNVSQLDWIMLACLLVVLWFGTVPLLADRQRTMWYWRRLTKNRLAMLAVAYIATFSVVAIIGPFLIGTQVANLYLQYQPPAFTSVTEGIVGKCVGPTSDGMCYGTLTYPLGTNILGLGVAYVIIQGARVSFLVVLVAASVIAPIATIVGVTTGYVGGTLDDVLMRYVDIQEAIPAFLVYIIAAFFLGKSLPLLLAVFGLLSWGGVARLVRSETLQRRSSGYVRAARAAGAGPLFVIRRHVLPNVRSTIVTATTQLIPGLLLAEIALGYLRLNDEVVRSWGWTLSFAISGNHGSFPVVMNVVPPASLYPELHEKWAPLTFTVVAVVLTIGAFAVLGDALRDILDPRTGGEP